MKYLNINKRYSNMQNVNKKYILFSSLGGIFEIYDFVVFLVFSKVIAEFFFPGGGYKALVDTYAIFAGGYIFRPVGGIIFGHFGDKFGRRFVFLLTITLMTVSTFGIGLIPMTLVTKTTAVILLISFRIVQGLSMGAEVPVAATFLYEHLDKIHRPIGVSILMATVTAGVLLATGVGALVMNLMPGDLLRLYGWKVPFLLGGVFGCFVFYTRWEIAETPAFKVLSNKKNILKVPLFKLIRTQLHKIIFGVGLKLINDAMVAVLYLMLPSYLSSITGYSETDLLLYTTIGVLLLCFSTVIWGRIISKVNLSYNMVYLFCVIMLGLLTFPFFYVVKMNMSGTVILLMYVLLSVPTGGLTAVCVLILTSFFPVNIRFTGLAVTYNVSVLVASGLPPLIISYLGKYFVPVYAPAYFMSLLSCIGFVSIIFVMLFKKEES